ncbi:proteoglycan 4-like isoform X2 [Penaeus monodon]|uniref:proteoglycan 4-like isoform X2 n=1 Tax=Penaeus monodon TaxID=6687 RepID=UPI0018A70D3A|nr:proteoglycan 4-like isoform X2 [Penaeus monodon]
MKLFLPVTITLSAIIVFVVAAPNAEPSSLAQDQQVQDAENQEAVDSAEVNVATPTVISKEDLSKATLDKKAPTVPLGAGVALPVKAIIAKKSRHANTKAKSKSKSPKTSASEKVPTKAGPPVNVKTSAKIGTESEQTIPATEDENPATLEPEPKPATPVDVKTTDLFLPATVELTADEGITQQRKAEEKTAPAKVDMTSKVEILEVTEATKGKSDTEQSGQVEPSPQPTEDKPTPKQPAEDKPTPKQPAKAKPTPKQPVEDKPTPKQPAR